MVCEAFVPGMIARRYGRIVNVSSQAGQLTSMSGYAPAYSMSNAALNAFTRQLAAATKGRRPASRAASRLESGRCVLKNGAERGASRRSARPEGLRYADNMASARASRPFNRDSSRRRACSIAASSASGDTSIGSPIAIATSANGLGICVRSQLRSVQ